MVVDNVLPEIRSIQSIIWACTTSANEP
jgi:hypothetical protein